MQSTHLILAAALMTGLTLSGCTHEPPGREHAMMMKSGGKGCMMQDHDKSGVRGADREPGKEMAGCKMMDQKKEPTPRGEAEADPHAEHHP